MGEGQLLGGRKGEKDSVVFRESVRCWKRRDFLPGRCSEVWVGGYHSSIPTGRGETERGAKHQKTFSFRPNRGYIHTHFFFRLLFFVRKTSFSCLAANESLSRVRHIAYHTYAVRRREKGQKIVPKPLSTVLSCSFAAEIRADVRTTRLRVGRVMRGMKLGMKHAR